MSQTSACPDVPDDVSLPKLPPVYRYGAAADGNYSADCMKSYATAAILADRASRALPSTALAARPEEGDNLSDTTSSLEGEWYCEQHPAFLFGHDGCKCAGITANQRIPMLTNQVRLAEQEVRELHHMYRDFASQFRALRTLMLDDFSKLDYNIDALWLGSMVSTLTRERDEARAALVTPSTPPTAGDGHD